ncbi:hypothetical protein QCA50_016766 [Cerrena zonata]|uniref:Fungal-type protein kinase domain-containing protein n=1 Tax=Cerrena zonata TaxID=2478898 RepID=A0AAW0FJ58_9APHY
MRMIVFKKLIPITDTTVENLSQPFLETIQCHALLWSLGIRHGDISVTNLMVDPESRKGILNDFDLTKVVNTFDARSLRGNDRVGTMVFMALDLLKEKGLPGRIARLYRHDLESFCWVFLWICYCYENGKVTLRFPFKDWISTTPRSCRRARLDVTSDLDEVDTGPSKSYAGYEDLLPDVVEYWVSFHVNMKATFKEPDEIQVLRSVLGVLPRSPEVEMQWAYTYTHICPTSRNSE